MATPTEDWIAAYLAYEAEERHRRLRHRLARAIYPTGFGAHTEADARGLSYPLDPVNATAMHWAGIGLKAIGLGLDVR